MNGSQVIFTSEDHSYWCGDERYDSVSKVFESVKPKTDWDYNAGRFFFKREYPELYDRVKKDIGFDHPSLVDVLIKESNIPLNFFIGEVEAIRGGWKDNSEEKSGRGTAWHSLKEEEDYNRGWAINPCNNLRTTVIHADKDYDNQTLADNLYDLVDGYYPELLIPNHKYKMAGQADKVFIETIDNKRFIDIDDWKTDAVIRLKPDFRHPKKGYEMLEYPLNHLYHTNHNIYMIKIGIYAWMLEQFGFHVRGLFFTSVDITDELELLSEQRYTIPYKKWEIEQLLHNYRKNL